MDINTSKANFSALIQSFFCQRLIAQRNASKQTIASYRDTFRLLLKFAQRSKNKKPTDLTLEELDAPFILDFLDHLEKDRGNSVRTRNNRLAAIRSFMRYASFNDPKFLPTVQRVLAIPMKRFERPLLDFLSREEVQAIIDAPDESTWSGHRDHVMFATLYNTGCRVSEVISLCVGQVHLKRKSYLQIYGKGRKERVVPLWKSTVTRLTEWFPRIENTREAPVFPNRSGKPLSRSGVEYRLRLAHKKAVEQCPTLKGRRITPHTLRHTTAMHLLQSGVDITVISLWLGHENPTTTHEYMEADIKMKERAIAKLKEPVTKNVRYQPTNEILAFLERL